MLNALTPGQNLPSLPALRKPLIKASPPSPITAAIFRIERGYIRLIPDLETLAALGFEGGQETAVPENTINVLPKGPPIPHLKRTDPPSTIICLVAKGSPHYWQGMGWLHLLKNTGIIKSIEECRGVASDSATLGAALAKIKGADVIVTALIKLFAGEAGKCACNEVF